MNADRRHFATAAGALMLAAAWPARADEPYPSRAIHIVVPFSAGGIVDSIARLIGERLSAKYGEAVVVDNRTGAGGSIGTEYVAKAAPDGYTMLCVSPGHATAPSLIRSVTWDPARDFRAVAGFGFIPNVVVVRPDVPAKTLPELIALARHSDSPLTFASAGVGTSNHLAGELLAQSAGIKLTHVPYKGQPDALNDLLSGRVTMMPLTAALAAPYIKAGKLRALAVTTLQRSSALPEVPTVAESAHLPGFDVSTWFGFVVPAKVPDAIVQKLWTDVSAVLARPEIKAKLTGLGMELAPQPPAEFDAFIAREVLKWTQVIKRAGIQAQ